MRLARLVAFFLALLVVLVVLALAVLVVVLLEVFFLVAGLPKMRSQFSEYFRVLPVWVTVTACSSVLESPRATVKKTPSEEKFYLAGARFFKGLGHREQSQAQEGWAFRESTMEIISRLPLAPGGACGWMIRL